MSYSVSTQHQPLGSGKAQSIVYTPPSTESSSEHDFDINEDRESYKRSMEEMRYQDSSPEPMQYMYGRHADDDDDEDETLASVLSKRGNNVEAPGFDNRTSTSATSPVFSKRSLGRKQGHDHASELRRLAGESIAEMQQKIKDLERLRIKEQHSMAAAKFAYQSEQEEMIFRLETKHNDELLQLKQEHAAKLRETRKHTGYNTELVQGLHRSYGKQVENLILEVTDLEKTNEVLRSRLATSNEDDNHSVASTLHEQGDEIAGKIPSLPARDLQVKIQFVSFKTNYDVPSIEVPHPGSSFGSLGKNVKSAISNYLAFLRSKDSIHSSSADSALIYRLSLNLDECTKLLFFGKGDPNGEEITEEKWTNRGQDTFDLIACVSPPRMPVPAVVVPSARSVSSHVSEKTARQYDEPPATATSMGTERTSTIWGKAPLPSASYSHSDYFHRRESIISEEFSERSSSPGRAESPVLGSANDGPQYAQNAFDVSREIRRINSELNKLQGSRHSNDDLSSQEEDDFEPAPKLSDSDYLDAFQAGGLVGYLRCRQPLLKQAVEAGDYSEHIDATEDDEESSHTATEHASIASRKASTVSRLSHVSYTYSGYKQPFVVEDEDENHQYQMVGDGVDETLRHDDGADEDGDADDEEGVHLSDSQQLEAQQGSITQNGALPLYVDEFLMGPVLDRTLDKGKGKGKASSVPSSVSSTKEGTFPELEHLSESRQSDDYVENFSNLPPRPSSRISDYQVEKSRYVPMSPILTGSKNRFSRLAESDMVEPLLAKDDHSGISLEAELYDTRPADNNTDGPGQSSSSNDEARSRTSSVPPPINPPHIARSSVSSANYASKFTATLYQDPSDRDWESSSLEQLAPRLTGSVDTTSDSKEYVQRASAAAAFAALPSRATHPLPNPHSQQPQFGVYGFPPTDNADSMDPQQPVHAPDPPLSSTSPSPAPEYVAPRMNSASRTSTRSTDHTYRSEIMEAPHSSTPRFNSSSQYLELDDGDSGEATPTLESIRRVSTVPTTYDEYLSTVNNHPNIYAPPPSLPPPPIRSALMPSNPYSQLYSVQPSLSPEQAILANNALAAAGVDSASLTPTQFYEFATSPPSMQRDGLGLYTGQYADLSGWTRRQRATAWYGSHGGQGPRYSYGGQEMYGYPREHSQTGPPQWPW